MQTATVATTTPAELANYDVDPTPWTSMPWAGGTVELFEVTMPNGDTLIAVNPDRLLTPDPVE
jgi:hypothetical protein